MTNSSAPQHHSTTTIQHPTGGVVEVSKTHTLVPAPAHNPLMSMDSWAPLLAFVLAIAGVLALFVRAIDKRLQDRDAIHAPVHKQIDDRFHRLVNDIQSDRAAITALQTSRDQHFQRIVALEVQYQTIKEGQDRIAREVQDSKAEIIGRINALLAPTI